MGSSSSSINTFSLHCSSQLLNPKIQRQTSYNLLETPLIVPIHIHNSLTLHPKLQPSKKSQISSIPNSNPSLITCSFSAQKEFFKFKFLSEKIVTLLLGSFIFMGCLNSTRPVLAQISQENSYSETREERREKEGGGNISNEEEVETMYLKLLEENPRNVEALKTIFYGKMKRGKTKEAVEYVERLIGVEPKEVEWRLLQALCYDMIGQLSKAKRLFKNILKERPLLLRALHGLAMVMHKNLEGPAVFEMLNKALEVARHEKRVTTQRNISILIAQMHVVKGELEDALNLFQELVSENPRDFRAYLCQGIVYSLLDKKEGAEEQFVRYRSLVPEGFPQRGFLDDVVLAAKTESGQTAEGGV